MSIPGYVSKKSKVEKVEVLLVPQSTSLVGPQITCDIRYVDEESFKNIIAEQVELGWPDITDQQKVFVVKYLTEFNYYKAAQESGLDSGAALRLLRDPLINAYVKHLRQGLEARELLTREMAAQNWIELIPRLKGEIEVPVVTKSGEVVNVKKYFAAELLRAISELSKISGLTPIEAIETGKKSVSVTLNFGGLNVPQPITTVVSEQ